MCVSGALLSCLHACPIILVALPIASVPCPSPSLLASPVISSYLSSSLPFFWLLARICVLICPAAVRYPHCPLVFFCGLYLSYSRGFLSHMWAISRRVPQLTSFCLPPADPFAKGADEAGGIQQDLIHIRYGAFHHPALSGNKIRAGGGRLAGRPDTLGLCSFMADWREVDKGYSSCSNSFLIFSVAHPAPLFTLPLPPRDQCALTASHCPCAATQYPTTKRS